LLGCSAGTSGSVRRGSTLAPLAARCAWLALLRALSAVPAATAATATATTFGVFTFLDRARLRLGDGRHLVGRCTRLLRRPGFAWRTLLLRVARSLACVIAWLVALAVPRLTLSPCLLPAALRRPRLRPFALLIPCALAGLARLVATLLALISAPIAVLTSAPARVARHFGSNRRCLHCRLRRFRPKPS
jgi:hypothetical protein